MNKTFLVLTAVLAAASCVAASAADWAEPAELGPVRAALTRMKEFDRVKAEPEEEHAASPESAAQKLLSRKRSDLEALYKASAPGQIPDGKSRGFAAVAPGTAAGGVSQALFSLFWHGKVFDRARGELVNRLTVGRLVKAKVFIGPSWLDGKPSVIIDYKGTSWVAGAIRDEIREISPGVYLGFAYVRDGDGDPRADIVFALDFN